MFQLRIRSLHSKSANRRIRGWIGVLTILVGTAWTPLATADSPTFPDQQIVGYDALVEYLSQPPNHVKGARPTPEDEDPPMHRGHRTQSRDYEFKPKGQGASQSPLRITVPFDFAKAELTPIGREQLDTLAQALRHPSVGDRIIALEGHCDERGTERYNLGLSQRRVLSAQRYLGQQHQISENRVIGYGYGESRPEILNARTETEHAVNRRVVIQLLDGPIQEQNRVRSSQLTRGHSPPKKASDSRRLKVDWGIVRTNTEPIELIHDDDSARLRSGDEYRVYVRPNATSYVYVFQIDSNGVGGWLFPSPDSLGSNPLPASGWWIPSPDGSFELLAPENRQRIKERIYLVASRSPISESERSRFFDPTALAAAEKNQTKNRGQTVVPKQPQPGSDSQPPWSDSGASRIEIDPALQNIVGPEGADWLWDVIQFVHAP